jgi:RimJ/RimL family protein N-acetyltransferase
VDFLRTLEIEQDLARFNRWQNSPRVASFWQEEGSLEQHREYLSKLDADPHTLTLIGCFDDQPFAYFEAYWAKEDRIAPFYDADNYDRGIHMLVGEENHRGPHKVASWLSALVHYLFLDDPRTQRVVAEPRADNAKMIGHMHNQCFHCEKEFDFPHKRAALMILGRERFLIGASWRSGKQDRSLRQLAPHGFCIRGTAEGCDLSAISRISDDPSRPHPHGCPTPCGSAPVHRES